MVATIRPLDGLVLALLPRPVVDRTRRRAAASSRRSPAWCSAPRSSRALVLPYNARADRLGARLPDQPLRRHGLRTGQERLGLRAGQRARLGRPRSVARAFAVRRRPSTRSSTRSRSTSSSSAGRAVRSLLVWIALVLGETSRAIDRAWIVFVLAIVASNSLYWFAGGPDFGARYWYLAIVPLHRARGDGFERARRA